MRLVGEYYILGGDEKRRFSQSAHEYLIEQVQYQGFEETDTADLNATIIKPKTYRLNFNSPIKYIAWGVVNEGTQGNNKGMGPCYFVSQTTNSLYNSDGGSRRYWKKRWSIINI